MKYEEHITKFFYGHYNALIIKISKKTDLSDTCFNKINYEHTQ